MITTNKNHLEEYNDYFFVNVMSDDALVDREMYFIDYQQL